MNYFWYFPFNVIGLWVTDTIESEPTENGDYLLQVTF